MTSKRRTVSATTSPISVLGASERLESPPGAASVDLSTGGSWERRQPARRAEFGGDVLVPLTQGLITGVAAGAVGGLLSGSWTGAVVAGVCVFGVTWVTLLLDHRRALWTVERVTGRDLDHDGVVGEPEQRGHNCDHSPPTVRVELAEDHDGGHRLRWFELPIDDHKLSKVAHAVLQEGAAFSRRGLAGVLSQHEYERLSSAMLDGGLLVDVGGNKRVLSGSGRALLRRVAVAR